MFLETLSFSPGNPTGAGDSYEAALSKSGRLVVTALAAGLLMPPAAPGTAETVSDRRAIEALLERRAAAVIRGDRDAFMSTVAGLSPSFRRRQSSLFNRMALVPLESYKLSVAWERFGDLATPQDRSAYPGADAVVIPVTEERYRLAGFDRTDAIEDLFYTYVKKDGEWLIAEDTDTDDLTLYSARHPWDLAPIRVADQGHFLLLTPRCRTGTRCGSAPPNVLLLAEAALRRVDRYWRPAWPHQMPLIVPRTARELKRQLQLTFDVGNFVAFAYATVDPSQGFRFAGHRVFLNPNAFVGRPRDSTLDILAHEFVHIATRSVSGPFVPAFVEEGIAEYVRHEGAAAGLEFLESEAASGRFDGRLPEDYEFTVGAGIDIFRSYQESYSAVRFFIRRWGLRSFTRFYRLLGRQRIRPGTGEYHVDRSLRLTIGLDLDEFERAWASSIAGS